MITLPGYHLSENIYQGTRTLVDRGTCKTYLGEQEQQQPVIIKVLRNEYPSLNERVQFRNQYTIARSLNFPGIIQTYALEPCDNRYILVMEDFGGIPLAQFIQGKPLDLGCFLTIAIQLSEILHELYQNRVIHKDIKPAHILISLNGANFNETSALEIFRNSQYPYGLSTYFFAKAWIHYTHGDYLRAYEFLLEAKETDDSLYSQFQIILHSFYHGLCLAERYLTVRQLTQQNYLEQLKNYIHQLKKLSENCPENYLIFYLILRAEFYRIQKNYGSALEDYDQAIAEAQEHQYLPLEALENELAAQFYEINV